MGAERQAEAAADVCEIHEDNAMTFAAFIALQTQWRLLAAGMGGLSYLGLDYAAVRATLDLLGIRRKERAGVFDDLRVMERAALPILNERLRGDDDGR